MSEERKRRIDDLKKQMAKIVAQGEQDQFAVDGWLINSSRSHVETVADFLDRDFDDPVMKSVVRLASLAFNQAITRNTIGLHGDQS